MPARRWRVLFVPLVLVFLVGIPGNIRALQAHGVELKTIGNADLVLAIAHTPVARQVPPASQPLASAPGLTVGWLVEAEARGQVPEPRHPAAALRAKAELVLSLGQATRGDRSECRDVGYGDVIDLQQGNAILFATLAIMVYRVENGAQVALATYKLGNGAWLNVLAGPIQLLLVPPVPNAPAAEVCA